MQTHLAYHTQALIDTMLIILLLKNKSRGFITVHRHWATSILRGNPRVSYGAARHCAAAFFKLTPGAQRMICATIFFSELANTVGE